MPCMAVIHQTHYRAFYMFSNTKSGHMSDSEQKGIMNRH